MFRRFLFIFICLFLCVLSRYAHAVDNVFYSFDMNFSFTTNDGFDKGLLVSTLQGLVNREKPNLYIYRTAMPWSDYVDFYTDNGFSGADDFWIKQATKPGNWLAGYKEEKLSSIESLLEKFSYIKKVVVWDPRVGATSNVAVTISGVETALPVMYGGLMYQKLVNELGYEVITNLYELNFADTSRIPGSSTTSSGSSKVNAYIWAKEKYIDSGKVNPNYLGYLEHYFGNGKALIDPADQITARDIVVSKKGFLFDLLPWSDEKPIDDPNQSLGRDKWIFEEILKSASAKANWKESIIEVFGYPAWWSKYCKYKDPSSKYECWQTEHEAVKILSSYGAGLLALSNLGTNNLSFHQHFWDLNSSVWQNNSNFPELMNKTYVMYVSGDGDSPELVRSVMYPNMENSKSANIPISWGITSNNYRYHGDVVDFFYKNMKQGDSVVGHISGCIYIFPDYWPDNKWESYLKYCSLTNSRMDIAETAFIGKGDNITSEEKENSVYLNSMFSISGNGLGISSEERKFGDNFIYKNRMPVIAGMAPLSDVDSAYTHIIDKINNGYLGNRNEIGKKPKFFFIRFDPSFNRDEILRLHNALNNKFSQSGWGILEAVNSKDFYYLARMATLDPNYLYRASYRIEGMPTIMGVGETARIKVIVRNNGKDIWYKNGDQLTNGKPYRLTSSVIQAEYQHSWDTYNNGDYSPGRLELTNNVGVGQTTIFSFILRAPSELGRYRLAVDMMREFETSFREQGQPPLEMEFEVKEICQALSGEVNISHLINWYQAFSRSLYQKEADYNCDKNIDIKDLIWWYGIYKK